VLPPRLSPRSRAAALSACGLVLCACVASFVWEGPPYARIASHLAVYGVAFSAYVAALAVSPGLSRRGLLAALGVALLWRVALVSAPPLLSDDINRYVWEGRVQLHGGNPYRWADRPTAGKWEPLRDDVWDGLNHAHYTAVYPPLFELFARGVVAVHDSVTAMKAFLVACEVLTLGVLASMLRRRGLGLERLLVLAWSPLALLEIAGSGHNEAFGMLWMVLALFALERGWPLVSALAAGAGFMSKLLPGLVAVAWARRYRAAHVAAAAALAALVAWPYLDARGTMLLSLSKYARYWRFNETLFAPLSVLLGSHAAAVSAGALLTLAVALGLAWRRVEPAPAALVVVVASLLLSPNVLEWYALWLVPLLVLVDSPGALLFTGTVCLAYLAYPGWQSGEPWHLGWGMRALEYGPCVVVALRARLDRGVGRTALSSSGPTA
jgi:alpha-1,6-mannosyltransferase